MRDKTNLYLSECTKHAAKRRKKRKTILGKRQGVPIFVENASLPPFSSLLLCCLIDIHPADSGEEREREIEKNPNSTRQKERETGKKRGERGLKAMNKVLYTVDGVVRNKMYFCSLGNLCAPV